MSDTCWCVTSNHRATSQTPDPCLSTKRRMERTSSSVNRARGCSVPGWPNLLTFLLLSPRCIFCCSSSRLRPKRYRGRASLYNVRKSVPPCIGIESVGCSGTKRVFQRFSCRHSIQAWIHPSIAPKTIDAKSTDSMAWNPQNTHMARNTTHHILFTSAFFRPTRFPLWLRGAPRARVPTRGHTSSPAPLRR